MTMASKVMRPPSLRVEGAGAQPREDVAPLPHVEVAPGPADQPRARRPAAAPEHLLGAEVRLRILLVRIADETGIRRERVRHPFPDVADHLPAADRAVAGGKRAHV